MVSYEQALRAHYHNGLGGFPRNIYIARLGELGIGEDHGRLARSLAAQVTLIRDSQGVGAPMSADGILVSLHKHVGSEIYVANSGAELSLNGCLGYAAVTRGQGLVRVYEAAVRERGPNFSPTVHLLTMASLLRTVLHETPDPPGDLSQLEQYDLSVASAPPLLIEKGTMAQLGLRAEAGDFMGEASQVYAQAGMVGLK